MKLSEMNTRQMADALCKLAEPIGNMVADKHFTDAFATALKRDQEGTIGEQIAHAAKAVLPQILGTHFDDLIAIAAAGRCVVQLDQRLVLQDHPRPDGLLRQGAC